MIYLVGFISFCVGCLITYLVYDRYTDSWVTKGMDEMWDWAKKEELKRKKLVDELIARSHERERIFNEKMEVKRSWADKN